MYECISGCQNIESSRFDCLLSWSVILMCSALLFSPASGCSTMHLKIPTTTHCQRRGQEVFSGVRVRGLQTSRMTGILGHCQWSLFQPTHTRDCHGCHQSFSVLAAVRHSSQQTDCQTSTSDWISSGRLKLCSVCIALFTVPQGWDIFSKLLQHWTYSCQRNHNVICHDWTRVKLLLVDLHYK